MLLIFCLSLFAGPGAEDLLQLYDTLKENHIDFFNTVDEDSADSHVQDLLGKADGMDPVEFYYAASSVAALAHDSHTSVSLSYDLLPSLSYLPVIFDVFGGEAVVVVSDEDYSSLLDRKVSKICGLDLDEILHRASAFVSSDNDVHLLGQLKDNHLVFREFYEVIGAIGEDEDVVLTLDDGSTVILTTQSYEEYATSPKVSLMKALPPTLNTSSHYNAMACADSNAVVVNYNMCAEMEGYPMESFASDFLDVCRQNGYGKIIIDLRYNPGGDSTVIKPLLDVLEEYRSQSGCELFVLIGEDTFSSAVLNALELKAMGASLVGRPTGGSASHYGEIQFSILANSHLTFSWSTEYFPGPYEGSLLPDIEVERNVEDYANGVDTDLAYLGVV